MTWLGEDHVEGSWSAILDSLFFCYTNYAAMMQRCYRFDTVPASNLLLSVVLLELAPIVAT